MTLNDVVGERRARYQARLAVHRIHLVEAALAVKGRRLDLLLARCVPVSIHRLNRFVFDYLVSREQRRLSLTFAASL